MKQFNLTFLLIILMSMVGVKALAYDIAVENDDGVTIYYNYINGNTLAVTYKRYGEQSYSGNVVIPPSVTYNEQTYNVTSIGEGAFQECWGLTSITIGNSVTSIGDNAFFHCSGLTSVTIGNSVTSIGDDAFRECSGLTSITIPNSVTSINERAFIDCTGLTTLIILCKEVGFWVNPMHSLKEVTLGEEVTSVKESIEEDFGPEGRTTIVNRAFDDCRALTSVTILCKNVGSWFSGMESIKEVTLGEEVNTISDFAFWRCSGLTSVTILCKNVGKCFSGMESIKEVTLGEEVTTIGDFAFSSCSGLTSITIPKRVTSIGKSAFEECSGLISIAVKDGNTNYDSRNDCNAIIETSSNILIRGCMNTVIPNSVTSIGKWAFRRCSGLTAIKIPNSVSSIGDGAFESCTGLTSIEIPNSVSSIGDGAFRDCTGLTSIEIPNSVTSISDYTFYGCSGLTSVTSPNSVTSIGDDAFYICSGLTSVVIPNSVTSIGDDAFRECSGLTSVVSLIEEPFNIDYSVFYHMNINRIYDNATLYVPDGTIDKYKATESWNRFVNIEEGATGINDIKEDLSKQYRYYDLNGNQSLQPRKGVNIVRMSNGKTKKVVVK